MTENSISTVSASGNVFGLFVLGQYDLWVIEIKFLFLSLLLFTTREKKFFSAEWHISTNCRNNGKSNEMSTIKGCKTSSAKRTSQVAKTHQSANSRTSVIKLTKSTALIPTITKSTLSASSFTVRLFVGLRVLHFSRISKTVWSFWCWFCFDKSNRMKLCLS